MFILLLLFAVSCQGSSGAGEQPISDAAPNDSAATDSPLEEDETEQPFTNSEEISLVTPVLNTPEIPTPEIQTTPTDPPAADATPSHTPVPSSTPMPTPTATLARPLEAQWYEDSDGNQIPDFLEVELGYDPFVDDCAPATCSMDAGGGSALSQEQNILLILDASGSMAEAAGGFTKMEAAKEAISDYVLITEDLVNIGFMVLGHKGDNTEAGKPESCAGVELLSPIGATTGEEIATVMSTLEPTGWTPLAGALTAAEGVFADRIGAANKVILVTDGLETCGGDPIAVAEQLHLNPNIELTVDVVGFGIQSQADAAQLQQIAEAGGGVYYDAQTPQDIREYFNQSADQVYQRFDFAVCIVSNSVNYSVCSNQMVLNATVFIQPLQIQAPPNDPAKEAYLTFIQQIRAAKEASDQRYEAFKNELDALLLQQAELEQLRQDLFGEE